MSWMRAERIDRATDRILDAAGSLIAEQGIDGPGMDEIARTAGCSRATLYRYFENRHALMTAFAHREARRLGEEIRAAVSDRLARSQELVEPNDGNLEHQRAVELVLACLAAVRARPYLRTWYAGDSSVLRAVLRESSLIRGIAASYLEPDAAQSDQDAADWLLRIVLSFLIEPGSDEAQERRLLDRFLILSGNAATRRPGRMP